MIIFMIILALTLISIPLVYYLFDKVGLKIMFLMLYILSFIFSFKTINVLNIDFSLMIVAYVGMLTIIYIYIEKMKGKDLKKLLVMLLLFISFIIISIILLLLYNQSVTDLVTANINRILKNNILLLVSFPIVTTISIYCTYKIYNLMKKNSNILFINVSLTTILVGIIDCIIFDVLTYLRVLNLESSIKLGLGNYLLKIVLSIVFIPVISYVVNRKKGVK